MAVVVVITAAVGGPHLAECVRSVACQTAGGVEHWVVVDGKARESAVRAALPAGWAGVVLVLPQVTGADGWNGHRIYAAVPWLVNAQHVAFLDEDNAFEPTHIQGLLDSLARAPGASWAYSLRSIMGQDGTHLCYDDCESLGGLHHTVCGRDDRLVDTSCYLLQRDVALAASPLWNARARDRNAPEVDRALASALLRSDHEGVACKAYSVRYRIASTALSVSAAFFEEGNRALGGHSFGSKRTVYLLHFSATATADYVACPSASRNPFVEWQMTLWSGLQDTFNLVDGFANLRHIPRGALIACAMCDPNALPLDFLKARTDCTRLVYTVEGPNIRHQSQWHRAFLESHFDHVLTYYQPLLLASPRLSRFCPMNTHHMMDVRSSLRGPCAPSNQQSICMVLERRINLDGAYVIDGVALRCLDPLREAYARSLRQINVYGVGWEGLQACRGITVAHTLHRSRDPRFAVDIKKHYTFDLIVENCDAPGYVSEKIYDSLAAGCIPLYYGNAGTPDMQAVLPPDMYVDLRGIPPENLQAFLDALDVPAWKAKIMAGRERVLQAVSARAFADCVLQTIVRSE